MKKILAAIALSLLLPYGACAQETYYVNDELVITMRSGESTQNQIIRTLKSGTKLEVLETNKETGYSLARTAGGTEGWVLTRYLTATPIAKHRLAAAEEKSSQLEKELAELKTQFKQTSESREALDQSSNKLASENDKLNNELQQIRDISGNAIALNNDNKTLREKMIHLETELQAMEQQNSVLRDRSARDWFITGTGVTILGILIGLIIPKIRFQRKSNWNQL